MCAMSTRRGPVAAGEGALQQTLDALSSPIRREILWMLWEAELPAGEIAASFEVSAGTISAHLNALREAGLVVVRADGNFRRYRADQAAMQSVLPLLTSGDERWQTADDLPERALADASVQQWVTVTTDVPLTQQQAFDSFATGERYSAWLGVPVTIRDGRFAAELEWGTRVRGHYEAVAPPRLIAMLWDFDDDNVPFPGRQLVGYLRFEPTTGGCRVEVHQRAADASQSEFLAAAWSMVLGRLRAHAEHSATSSRRAPRPKRRDRRSG
jgi:DNA-binding transcriptional ArsR family regulator